jgi:hypothetical protein
MARLLNYPEKSLMRFVAGTAARIKAVLRKDEDRASFVRGAVEREIEARETERD